MTFNYRSIVALSSFLSVSLLACGGDSGDSGDDASGSTASASAGDTTADGPTTGDAPSTSEPVATEDPSTAAADTTADAGSDAGSDTTAGETTAGGVADCGFDPGLVYERTATIFQLVSADGETCVWLERRDDSEPDTIYKAVPYTLLEFKAGHAGVVDHLTDAAKMTWESTHHNWTDKAEAWNDSVRYKLDDLFAKDGAFENVYGLSAYDEATDALLWGPIELTPFQ